jgi:hypothetical protein
MRASPTAAEAHSTRSRVSSSGAVAPAVVATERAVREALRESVVANDLDVRDTVDEFWVPRSNERADMVAIGRFLDGFEVKTDRDTLKRLPRQAQAYGRLFDRCTAVVAERHVEPALALLPEWWGITTIAIDGDVAFRTERAPQPNPSVDAETLVRLLWRSEAISALLQLGSTPDEKRSRSSLWRELLYAAPLGQLRALVREALLNRDPASARFPSQRFLAKPAILTAGP